MLNFEDPEPNEKGSGHDYRCLHCPVIVKGARTGTCNLRKHQTRCLGIEVASKKGAAGEVIPPVGSSPQPGNSEQKGRLAQQAFGSENLSGRDSPMGCNGVIAIQCSYIG